MLSNVGGVKCQPFLKHSNHWKWEIKMIIKGNGCFQFPEAVVTSTKGTVRFGLSLVSSLPSSDAATVAKVKLFSTWTLSTVSFYSM